MNAMCRTVNKQAWSAFQRKFRNKPHSLIADTEREALLAAHAIYGRHLTPNFESFAAALSERGIKPVKSATGWTLSICE